VVLAALPASDSNPKLSKDGVPIIGITRALPDDVLDTGVWEELPSGRRVWRLGIRSPEAIGIRLHFTNFNVGKGRVWIYPGDNDGPSASQEGFSGQGIFDDGEFWSGVLFGESVVIEYEPEPGAPSEGQPPFQMRELSHLYEMPTSKNGSRVNAGTPRIPAAACHLDATCYPEWSASGAGVARMLFETEEGSKVCSGSLINTRAGSLRPYFLTANHCINNEASARSLLAFWFYQTSSCNGPEPDIRDFPSTLGARFLVGGGERDGDFSLLLFNQSPPPGVVFNGWDPNPLAAGSAVSGIHHPGSPPGDYKRISFGFYDAPSDEILDRLGRPSDKYRMILYTSGRTQRGSSGSPLFLRPGVLAGVASFVIRTPDDWEEDDFTCELDPWPTGYGAFSAAYPYLAPYLEDTRAHLLSPAPGSTLQSPTATFSWTSVPGALIRDFHFGIPDSNSIRPPGPVATIFVATASFQYPRDSGLGPLLVPATGGCPPCVAFLGHLAAPPFFANFLPSPQPDSNRQVPAGPRFAAPSAQTGAGADDPRPAATNNSARA
jgi:hypothetical protein